MKTGKAARVLFTRSTSIASIIERAVRTAKVSVDAALYRLEHPKLVCALEEAARREVRVRLVLDRGKYEMTPSTRELLKDARFPYRLSTGRGGNKSKMHHKFAVIDGRLALAGSFNWTLESEQQNFENLLTLQQPELVKGYIQEFAALWSAPARRRNDSPGRPRRKSAV